MDTVNDIAKGRGVPEHLAPLFLIRPFVEGHLMRLTELKRGLMNTIVKHGPAQIEPQMVLDLFDEIEVYLRSHVPHMPCECIDPLKCEACQGKEWLSIADLERLGSIVPRKSKYRLYVEQLSSQDLATVRAQRRDWYRRHGKAYQLASKQRAEQRKSLQTQPSEPSCGPEDPSEEPSGALAMDTTRPTFG
jgi:hypothetical protein